MQDVVESSNSPFPETSSDSTISDEQYIATLEHLTPETINCVKHDRNQYGLTAVVRFIHRFYRGNHPSRFTLIEAAEIHTDFMYEATLRHSFALWAIAVGVPYSLSNIGAEFNALARNGLQGAYVTDCNCLIEVRLSALSGLINVEYREWGDDSIEYRLRSEAALFFGVLRKNVMLFLFGVELRAMHLRRLPFFADGIDIFAVAKPFLRTSLDVYFVAWRSLQRNRRNA